MNYTIGHQLVGYDPQTERVAFKKEIPEGLMARVLRLVDIDDDDPKVFDSYPVDSASARNILGMIEAHEKRELDFFLEGFQRPVER